MSGEQTTVSIRDRVTDIVVEQLNLEKDKVKLDAKFIEDLGADSLDTVELVMALEQEFDIDIPDEVSEKITNLQEAIEFVERAIEGK